MFTPSHYSCQEKRNGPLNVADPVALFQLGKGYALIEEESWKYAKPLSDRILTEAPTGEVVHPPIAVIVKDAERLADTSEVVNSTKRLLDHENRRFMVRYLAGPHFHAWWCVKRE
jgi:hypothetical protein